MDDTRPLLPTVAGTIMQGNFDPEPDVIVDLGSFPSGWSEVCDPESLREAARLLPLEKASDSFSMTVAKSFFGTNSEVWRLGLRLLQEPGSGAMSVFAVCELACSLVGVDPYYFQE